jgi:hypothetical protein
MPRVGGIVIPPDLTSGHNALRKPAPHPATAPQPEPPEIFDTQDPLAPALIIIREDDVLGILE